MPPAPMTAEHGGGGGCGLETIEHYDRKSGSTCGITAYLNI